MLEEAVLAAINAGEENRMLELKLLRAIDDGNENAVEQIIAAGAKIDFDFNAPICRAALNGHLDIVRQLHEAGCRIDNPNVRNKVLKHAVWGNQPQVIDYLIGHGGCPPLQGRSLLKIAAREGSTEVFEKIADFGKCLDEVDESFLEAAEKGGSERIIRRILESNEVLRDLAIASTSWPLSKSIAAQIKLSRDVCMGETRSRISRGNT